MMNARIAKEVVVRLADKPGTLANLARLIADKGLNVLATCAWTEGDTAVLRFVTEDNLRVVDTFRDRKLNPQELEVVVAELPHKVGMLRKLSDRLVERGVDIRHLYVTTTPDQQVSMVVLATSNNERAVVALNEKH